MAHPDIIPIFSPVLGEEELHNIIEAVQTGWISSAGPFIARFEQQFAELCGVSRAEAVCNGTVALHAVLHAIGVGAGDEVIAPSQTFIATTAAVRYCNARVVFAEILPDRWTIDPDDVIRKLTPRTRAIIPVDLFGLCAEIPELRRKLALAKREDVFILEDAAEAFGSRLNGVCSGALGDAGTFSFYGNKTITTGEGGMVTTQDQALADKVRFLKNHAMSPSKRYYHPEVGFNFRMTNLQAAIGLAQLSRASSLVERKRQLHARYRSLLANERGVTLQNVPEGHFFVPWLTTLVDEALSGEDQRDQLMERLLEQGVDTRPMFYPNHLLPSFAEEPYAGRGALPITEHVTFRGLGLPSGAGLTDAQIDRIVETYVRVRKSFV